MVSRCSFLCHKHNYHFKFDQSRVLYQCRQILVSKWCVESRSTSQMPQFRDSSFVEKSEGKRPRSCPITFFFGSGVHQTVCKNNRNFFVVRKPVLYFSGNSLGLQPKGVNDALQEQAFIWAEKGADGYFSDWVDFHQRFLTYFEPSLSLNEIL